MPLRSDIKKVLVIGSGPDRLLSLTTQEHRLAVR